MVAGGGEYGMKTELWPGSNNCPLPNLKVAGAVGFLTAQGPTVCGGREGGVRNKCFQYREHQWMPWTNMGTARYYASAIQINANHNGKLLSEETPGCTTISLKFFEASKWPFSALKST